MQVFLIVLLALGAPDLVNGIRLDGKAGADDTKVESVLKGNSKAGNGVTMPTHKLCAEPDKPSEDMGAYMVKFDECTRNLLPISLVESNTDTEKHKVKKHKVKHKVGSTVFSRMNAMERLEAKREVRRLAEGLNNTNLNIDDLFDAAHAFVTHQRELVARGEGASATCAAVTRHAVASPPHRIQAFEEVQCDCLLEDPGLQHRRCHEFAPRRVLC